MYSTTNQVSIKSYHQFMKRDTLGLSIHDNIHVNLVVNPFVEPYFEEMGQSGGESHIMVDFLYDVTQDKTKLIIKQKNSSKIKDPIHIEIGMKNLIDLDAVHAVISGTYTGYSLNINSNNSTITLKGEVNEKLSIKSSGSSGLNMGELKCNQVQADTFGHSKLLIHVVQQIDAIAHEDSLISLEGNAPIIKFKTSENGVLKRASSGILEQPKTKSEISDRLKDVFEKMAELSMSSSEKLTQDLENLKYNNSKVKIGDTLSENVQVIENKRHLKTKIRKLL